MADYSIADIKAAVLGAGGSGPNVDVAGAVSLAENTGRSLQATSPNPDGSVDRGPWQINSRWHPEVPDSCAFDLACSTRAAAKISNNFTDFSAWTTFKRGMHLKFLPQVQATDAGAATADLAGFHVPGTGITIPGPSDIVNSIGKVALLAVFVAGGIAMVVMGAWQAVGPKVKAAQEKGAQAAQIAAVVA